MNKKLNKKQRIHYFMMNLFSFALIFILLGIIVFQLLQTSIYQSVDRDLKRWSHDQLFIEKQLARSLHVSAAPPPPLLIGEKAGEFPPNSFQQQVILWSQDKKIINEAELGSRVYDFQNLSLSTNEINKIISLQVTTANNQLLEFRSITIPIENQENVAYMQILMNTDPIKGTIVQVKQILIVCMLLFGLLSIGLSYFLSKWSMKPIFVAWQKQQEFVENASHELRTPLAIIQAKLEKLFIHPNHTIIEESETIALSLNEVHRLEQLTNDLLLLARSDSNLLMIEKEPTKINQFLEQVLAPYAELVTAEDKIFLQEFGAEEQVSFDKERIHQLLIILLDNGLKYTEPGDHISVFSSLRNNEWMIKIVDTGLGIADDKKQAVFERFYRGDQSRNRQTGGYGIGLSIAKWIVEMHQGRIEISDSEPKGTTVTILLPMK